MAPHQASQRRRRRLILSTIVTIIFQYQLYFSKKWQHDNASFSRTFVGALTLGPNALRRRRQQLDSRHKLAEREYLLQLSSIAKPETQDDRKSTVASSSLSSKSLHLVLQQSFTVDDILRNVALHLTPDNDPTGSLSSLTLVRLSKHMIADNNWRQCQNESHDDNNIDDGTRIFDLQLMRNGLQTTIHTLANAPWSKSSNSVESAVDGIKALAVVFRILSRQCHESLPFSLDQLCYPLMEKLCLEETTLLPLLQPHHLSGLHWAMDCFQFALDTTNGKHVYKLPSLLEEAHDALKLPFRIRQGLLSKSSDAIRTTEPNDLVPQFVTQVDFQSDTIRTTSTNRVVPERRQTAWQGDDSVAAFSYSGKSMERQQWSPIVEIVRECLHEHTTHYYDGCLLNLYPDGESGMRYHSDPDQGSLWDYETAVVSIGATRKFAFRSNPTSSPGRGDGGNNNRSKPHVFVLFSGDVTEMFRDCQERYQHTVKTADAREETAPRVSLVFKKTLNSMRSH